MKCNHRHRAVYFFLGILSAFFSISFDNSFAQDARGLAQEHESVALTEQDRERILSELDKSQKHYEDSIAKFQLGNYNAAKRAMEKSFKTLSSLFIEEGLIEQMKPDFNNMITKIRGTEMQTSTEMPSALLDISKEELNQTAEVTAAPVPASRQYSIKNDPNNALAQRYIAVYTQTRRDKVLQALERSGRYRAMIEDKLKTNALPIELFYLVMVESEYKLSAYSRASAAGLWQLMPATARKLGLKVNYWIDERFDPEKSTDAAIKYLKDLFEMFDDWHLALAAYNRGEHGIGRDLSFAKAAEFSQLSERNAVPQETEHFVPKFMACTLIGDNPKNYGFHPKYEQPETFDTVALDKPLDLQIAAKCAGTMEDVLRRLNPAIRAWCTPINYPQFPLRLPVGSRGKFLEELAKVKDWNPTRGVIRHKVRPGDALSTIARKYKTTVAALMKDNRIKDPKRLRPGQILDIRPGKEFINKKY
ncbi:MAG: transglycosylase SLT domain-containing protein [Elusimicrobia bacterium]|nr:transglycosylase SLT domain-containing protein [Elusimicrobiota bacterium]